MASENIKFVSYHLNLSSKIFSDCPQDLAFLIQSFLHYPEFSESAGNVPYSIFWSLWVLGAVFAGMRK